MKQKIHYLFMLLLMLLTGVGGVKAQNYELVTDVSSLADGDEVVIGILYKDGNKTKAFVAGDITSQYYLQRIIDSEFQNTTITSLKENAIVFKLGKEDNKWKFANSEGKLLGATAAKKMAWDKGTTTWTISIADGNATIASTTSDYGKILYNANSPRFLNYSSSTTASMLLVQLFKKVESGPSAEKTNIEIDATGITNTDVYQGTAAGSLSATVKDASNNAVSDATVTWESSNPGVATIDENGNVTLVAVGATTITATYAGNNDYQASSATYELTVTDNTPFEGGEVTFDAGTDKGSTTANNSPDEVSKSVVTISSTDAAFATSEYRFYANSTTTFSVPAGYSIAKIVFTNAGNDKLCSNLSLISENGNYSNNTWTGNATSVAFTASAQARASQIVVTVAKGTPLADPELSFSAATATATLGDSFTAPTLTNSHGLTVTYSSSNTSAATVDENTGAVTLVAAGETTITATFAGDDTYSAGAASYTLTVNAPVVAESDWVKTELSALTADDIFVIIGNNENDYALANDKGTGSAPTAVSVTVSGNYLTGTVADNIKWHVSGNATDGYTFYPNGSTTTWLYCTNTNNGVRVGTGEAKAFTQTTNSYLTTTQTTDQRYLGIYNSQDWRCYTSEGGNIADQTFAFYKYTGAPAPSITADAVEIAFDATSGSISYTINNGVEGGTLAATTEADWLTIGTVGENVPFTTTANETALARTADVVLTYAYGTSTTSKTITVTQAGNPSASGTVNNPYTVAEALEVIEALADNGKTSDVYVKGTISSITDVSVFDAAENTGYGNATYFISDGTNELEVFRGYFLKSAKFTAEDQIQVGDEVVVYGKLQKYVKDGKTTLEVTQGNYIVSLDRPEPAVDPGTPAAITAGFYTIKNLGNEKFVNVAGRKTATLVDNAEGMAGTVIQVESDADGIVKTLRSQGVDVPGYATRAMKYVPDVVKLVVEKLHVSGSGEILGETGVDKILDKFNKSVDVNLHVVHADGGYRIYGKTPSMTPVKEFYQENKANVDAKLPGLEQAINDAIATIVDKVGKGESLKNTFKLETIWKRMGWTDYEPGTEETTQVAFLQQVLANEENIWNFAYQTAMFYMEWVEGKQAAFQEMQDQAPELMKYWNLAKKVRPNFMYYIVQKDGKVDVISQGNEAILNNDKSTVWALEEVSEFKVNLATSVEKTAYPTTGGEAKPYIEYYGTLYTDFAYKLPEGVTAYKVTGINKVGDKVYVKKAELNNEVVPAQTPVLLIAANTGELTLTIAEGGEAVADNQLYGNDYLINEYDINTPQLEGVFTLLAQLSQSTYDKYEYLMRKNAGTVNNKYFFGIAVEGELADAYEAKTGKEEMESSPIRKLGLNTDGKVGFFETWDYLAGNEGFMFSEEVSEILMNIVGDVNRDGTITISDVTALVNIILGKATYPADADKYDFEAADVNGDKVITIADVTALVNIILGK